MKKSLLFVLFLAGSVFSAQAKQINGYACFTNGWLGVVSGTCTPNMLEMRDMLPTNLTFTATAPKGLALDNWALVPMDSFVNQNTNEYAMVSFLRTYEANGDTVSVAPSDLSVLGAVAYYLMPCFSWLSYTTRYHYNPANPAAVATATHSYTNRYALTTTSRVTGYSVSAWTNSVGTRYANKATVSGATFNATTNGVDVYAILTANVYKVTFKVNATSGSVSPSSKKVTYQGTYGTLPTPSRTGYWFDGWYTQPSGGTKVLSTSRVALASDRDLYAQWTKQSYTVTLDPNGGTVSPTSLLVTYGDAYGTLPVPTRDGYTWGGWFNSAGKAIVSTNLATSTCAQKLTAKWTANHYSIAFAANGGTGAMSVVTNKVFGQSVKLPANTFTRTGYRFAGWTNTVSGTVYANAATITGLVTVPNGTNTLSALWTPNVYTVSYQANGGTIASGHTAAEATVSATYDTAFTIRSGDLFTRSGCSFLNWTNAEGTVYAAGRSVKNLASAHGAVVKLYANWADSTYKIRFNANGGTGTMSDLACNRGETVVLPANAFTYHGKTFLGWATRASGSVAYANRATVTNDLTKTSSMTLYAVWKIRQNNYNAALDCTNLVFDVTSGTWSVVSNATESGLNAYGGTCLKVTLSSAGSANSLLTADLPGDGVLQFRWRGRLFGEDPFGMTDPLTLRSTWSTNEWVSQEIHETNADTWQQVTVTNVSGRVTSTWKVPLVTGSEIDGAVYLDHVVWTPAAVSTEPTAADAPTIQAFAQTDSGWTFTVTDTGDFTYTLQTCTDLADPEWTDVSSDPIVDGETLTFETEPTTDPQRFYRIKVEAK